MFHIRRKKPTMMKLGFNYCDISWTRKVIPILVVFSSLNLALSSHSARYSAPLTNSSDDEFKPMIFKSLEDSKVLADQVFTKTGRYRIFEPIESDLRYNRKEFENEFKSQSKITSNSVNNENEKKKEKEIDIIEGHAKNDPNNATQINDVLSSEFGKIEELLSSYLDELFVKKEITKSGITIKVNDAAKKGSGNSTSGNKFETKFKRFVRSATVNVPLPRAIETGRLFLFTGSASSAGFNRPSETVNDLNFKDNFEDDNKFMVMDNDGGYAYNQPEGSSNHFSTQLYDSAAINNNALSRFGLNDHRDNFVNSFGYDENKKANLNPDSASLSQLYQSFKKVPNSSLVLSNYDPFYSPLLSRLDAIFEQLGLKSKDESCKEKLVCFMYADPRKYEPYSNLVSAQLSRELDELRKPTSENPEILRFFRYMKAAKDGQDGDKCEETYSMCTDFKDFDNPAMINVFNDLNKLIEARKLLKK